MWWQLSFWARLREKGEWCLRGGGTGISVLWSGMFAPRLHGNVGIIAKPPCAARWMVSAVFVSARQGEGTRCFGLGEEERQLPTPRAPKPEVLGKAFLSGHAHWPRGRNVSLDWRRRNWELRQVTASSFPRNKCYIHSRFHTAQILTPSAALTPGHLLAGHTCAVHTLCLWDCAGRCTHRAWGHRPALPELPCSSRRKTADKGTDVCKSNGDGKVEKDKEGVTGRSAIFYRKGQALLLHCQRGTLFLFYFFLISLRI